MKKSIRIIALMLAVSCMMLCSCGNNNISKDCLNSILGEYQASGNSDDIGEWWHLSILDDEENPNYLSIYDNEAGNPGVEGEIMAIDEENIKIKIDPDYYDQLPSYDWKDDGEYLEMTYKVTDEGIDLTNNDIVIHFRSDV